MKELTALQYGYYSVTESKGSPRIWLQGGNLEGSNFTKGTPYEVIYNIDTRTIIYRVLKQATAKSRVVSGRLKPNGKYTPIIDLATFDLLDVTQGAKKIRADFYVDEVHICVHHMETKQKAREQRLKDNLEKKGEITKGVLCCGIGMSSAAGHDGLAKMGIKSRTEFIVDRERRYLDVAHANNHSVTSDTTIFEATLEELEPELLGFVDMLSVSLPCTGHSPAGKAKNKLKNAEEHLTDATAVFGLMRVIDACQPSIIVSENVVSARNSATYILIKSMLDICGYYVNEVELDSKDTHSIENRSRYWFVATSKGLPQVDLTNFPSFYRSYDVLGDLLENVPLDSKMWKSTAEKVRKAAVNKANGKNFGFNLVDGSVKNIGVCGRFYQKDRASEAHLAGVNDTMRLLTVNELCLAQSAPIHLVADTVAGTAYEGLGQGVDFRQGLGVYQMIARDVFNAKSVEDQVIKLASVASQLPVNSQSNQHQLCIEF